jgi:excisionase family DNA binding protein
MSRNETPDLLTVDEVAAKLGYSTGHIYNLVNRNEIPFKKLSRKALRFDPREIDAWIIEQNLKTKQEQKKEGSAA